MTALSSRHIPDIPIFVLKGGASRVVHDHVRISTVLSHSPPNIGLYAGNQHLFGCNDSFDAFPATIENMNVTIRKTSHCMSGQSEFFWGLYMRAEVAVFPVCLLLLPRWVAFLMQCNGGIVMLTKSHTF